MHPYNFLELDKEDGFSELFGDYQFVGEGLGFHAVCTFLLPHILPFW